LARCNQKNVDTTSQDGPDLLLFDFRIFLRRGENQAVIVFAQDAVQRFGKLREERVQQIRHHQGDDVALAARKAPGQHFGR
jgi:hypothetical protein